MPSNERPEAPPAPAVKTENDPDPIRAAMPKTIRNSIAFELAVRQAHALCPDTLFEDGERALEMLGFRYCILRTKVSTNNMEVESKEYYEAYCEMALVKARGFYDKAADALAAANFSMRSVYEYALQAASAPSISPVEFQRRRKEEQEEQMKTINEEVDALEREKRELIKKGCKSFDESGKEEWGQAGIAGNRTAGTAATQENTTAGASGGNDACEGAEGNTSTISEGTKQQGTGNKRGRGGAGEDVGDEALVKRVRSDV